MSKVKSLSSVRNYPNVFSTYVAIFQQELPTDIFLRHATRVQDLNSWFHVEYRWIFDNESSKASVMKGGYLIGGESNSHSENNIDSLIP